MTDLLAYMLRTVVMLLIAWAGIRMLGKKSISQMNSYELAGLMMLTTVASEPLVVKVAAKASMGVVLIGLFTMGVGWISLKRFFYNLDSKPSIVIVNGKIDQKVLKKNQMNLPYLLSILREKGFANVSEVEYAIFEPIGTLSVIPKSQERPVKPRDLKLSTEYEGLALPLIIDGTVQVNNLNYAGLDENWLAREVQKAVDGGIREVFLAELQTDGTLYIDLYEDTKIKRPELF